MAGRPRASEVLKTLPTPEDGYISAMTVIRFVRMSDLPAGKLMWTFEYKGEARRSHRDRPAGVPSESVWRCRTRRRAIVLGQAEAMSTPQSLRVLGKQASLNAESLRAQFPGLAERVNGNPLVYLDSAATTQRPH